LTRNVVYSKYIGQAAGTIDSTEYRPDRALLATRTGFITIFPIDLSDQLAPAKGNPCGRGLFYLI